MTRTTKAVSTIHYQDTQPLLSLKQRADGGHEFLPPQSPNKLALKLARVGTIQPRPARQESGPQEPPLRQLERRTETFGSRRSRREGQFSPIGG